jgi:hypothetical protein
MKRALLIIVSGVGLLLSTGCTSLVGTSATPVSSASYSEALDRGRALVKQDRNLRMLQVSDTGSMAPFLGESSILVMEPVKPRKIEAGNIISYDIRGEEKVHQVVRVTEKGVVAKGTGWWTEFVPYENITGRVTVVLYFDKTTLASAYSGKLPVAFANENAAYGAGLCILKAKMLTEGAGVKLVADGPGKFKLSLPHNAGLRLFVGAKGANWENASAVDVQWDGDRAGSSRKISLYDEANPGLGNILLNVTYED